MLAASSLGIASCPIGMARYIKDEKDIIEKLGFDENYELVLALVFGYADEEPPEPLRYNLQDVMYVEKWKRGQSPIQDLDDTLGYWGGVVRKRANYTREKITDKAEELKQKVAKKR